MASPVTPQDPAGLLTRIPELRILLSDARVAKAVASGNPFQLYRALFWGRLTGRLSGHRGTVERLVRNRRAFAVEIRELPAVGIVNGFTAALGIGSRLLGREEKAPDGSYVATHVAVILFAVPLFPIAAYVVSGACGSALSGSLPRVHARVPLGGGAWAWGRLAALAAVAGVIALGFGMVHVVNHKRLQVVNGFAQPAQVTLGRSSFTIPPGGREAVKVQAGTIAARATVGGAVVDEGPLEVSRGPQVVIWNLAGAAPVAVRQITYVPSFSHRSNDARDPDPVLHCGERLLSLYDVDYEFTDPPQTVSVRRGEPNPTRKVLFVVQEEGADGAAVCGYVLANQKSWPGAAAVLEQRARAAGWEPVAARQAIWGAGLVGLTEQVRVARAARDAQPTDVPFHRTYQDLALEVDGAAVREEYRKRAEAEPGSASAQYLHARLFPDERGLRLAEAHLRRFPDDPDLLRLVTGLRSELGDWAGVDRSWRVLRGRSAAAAGETLDAEAWALAAQGRHADALQIIEELFQHLEPSVRSEAAVLYARVAARSGAGDPGRLIDRLGEENQALLRAQAGLEPGEAEPSPAVQIMRTAASSPRDALARVAEAGPLILPSLDGFTVLLLYGEALRSEHAARAVLETGMRGAPDYLEPFRRFIRGEPGAAAGLRPQMRAAAELVRSRLRGLPAAERAALRAAAIKDDLLGTVVSRAAKAWPEPER